MKYAALVPILLIFVYVGAYIVLVSLPDSRPPVYIYVGKEIELKLSPYNNNGERILDYHGLPKDLFVPIHTIDKRWLRSSYWHDPDYK